MQDLVENLFRRANLGLAEDAVQEALIRALRTWPFRGVPPNPAAGLHLAARRYAVDQLRRSARQPGCEPLFLHAPPAIDDTLQLILLCCHPAIPPESHVALILKTVSGLMEAFWKPEVPTPSMHALVVDLAEDLSPFLSPDIAPDLFRRREYALC